MEDKIKLTNKREKESNEMIRQRDIQILEYLEAVNSLKSINTELKNEISNMKH